MQGSSLPLVIKVEDTKKERHAQRTQKYQSQHPNTPNTDSAQQPSLIGAMPMGYVPPPSFNGYGYQVVVLNRLSLFCSGMVIGRSHVHCRRGKSDDYVFMSGLDT